MDLELLLAADEPKAAGPRKLLKAVRDFRGYIEANQSSIPNYGDRCRNGEPISSAPAESAVSQVVSKRIVKKQQMRWSDRGAYLLLQLRARVLTDELGSMFQCWCPAMELDDTTLPLAV